MRAFCCGPEASWPLMTHGVYPHIGPRGEQEADSQGRLARFSTGAHWLLMDLLLRRIP